MKLMLLIDGVSPVEFQLEQGGNLIGRWDPDTKSYPEIDLEDYDSEALVSRRHALATVDGETLQLADLGSTNGTFLADGQKLQPNETHSLPIASEFFVGNLKLRFVR